MTEAQRAMSIARAAINNAERFYDEGRFDEAATEANRAAEYATIAAYHTREGN